MEEGGLRGLNLPHIKSKTKMICMLWIFYGTFLAALVPFPTSNNHLIFQQKALCMAGSKAIMDIKIKDIMQDTSEI